MWKEKLIAQMQEVLSNFVKKNPNSSESDLKIFLLGYQAALDTAMKEGLDEKWADDIDMHRAFNAGKDAIIDQKNGAEFISSQRFLIDYKSKVKY